MHPATNGAIRAAGAGDASIAGSVDERIHHVLEDHLDGNAATVTAMRMGGVDCGVHRRQRRKLYPDRLKQRYQ